MTRYEQLTSPSGLVRIVLPRRLARRWAIYVRDDLMATGRTWRGGTPAFNALREVAGVCDQTPGLGEAGAEIRRVLAALDDNDA